MENTIEKVLLEKLDEKDPESMNNIGAYYYSIDETDKIIEYLVMASDKKYVIAMINLAEYYENTKQDEEKMICYYTMACDNGSIKSAYKLGIYYENKLDLKEKPNKKLNRRRSYSDSETETETESERGPSDDEETRIKKMKIREEKLKKKEEKNKNAIEDLRNKITYYYHIASSNGIVDATYRLGIFYLNSKDCKETGIKYLEDAGEKHNHGDALYELGNYYSNINENEKASKYYSLCGKTGNINLIIKLIDVYSRKNMKDQMINVCILGIMQENKYCMDVLYQKTDYCEMYVILDEIKEKNKMINNMINELAKNKNVRNMINKIRMLSKQITCDICFDEKVIGIPLECAHYYCVKCYSTMKKCPVCDIS